MKIPYIRFKDHNILGDLELDFTDKNGEPYSNIIFVGENGCGKTTLLRELNNFPYGENLRDFVKKHCVRTGRRLDWCSVFLKERINSIHLHDETYSPFWKLDKNKKNRLNTIGASVNIREILQDRLEILDDYEGERDKPIKDEKYNDPRRLLQDVKANSGIWFMKTLGSLLESHVITGKFDELLDLNNFYDILSEDKDSISSGEYEILMRTLHLLDSIQHTTDFVLIDEPELGLHPKWQFKILKFYKEALYHRNFDYQAAQLFVASHSENILKSESKGIG